MELIICKKRGDSHISARFSIQSKVVAEFRRHFPVMFSFFLGMINVCKKNLDWHIRKWG